MLCHVLCAAAALTASPVAAQDYPIQGVAAFEILPGYETGGGHMMAARIRMKPGWKTYWRAPGGNGIPPIFDWSGSKNLKALRFHWPAPKVYMENGYRTIGYTSDLVLPIEVTPHSKGQPVQVKGKVSFGICEDICLPVEARFSATLDGTVGFSDVIKSALATRPLTGKKAGVRNVGCVIRPASDGMAVTARLQLPGASATQFVVLEYSGGEVWAEQDQTQVQGSRIIAGATLYPLSSAPLIIDRSKLRLTVLGGANAVEIVGCPAG